MLLDKKEVMRRSSSNITSVLIDTINAQAEVIESLAKRISTLEKKPNAPKKTASKVAGSKSESK